MEEKEFNRIEMTIRCEVGKEKEIGEMMCRKFQGNPNFVSNELLVNYTDDPGTVYVVIGKDARPTKIDWTL